MISPARLVTGVPLHDRFSLLPSTAICLASPSTVYVPTIFGPYKSGVSSAPVTRRAWDQAQPGGGGAHQGTSHQVLCANLAALEYQSQLGLRAPPAMTLSTHCPSATALWCLASCPLSHGGAYNTHDAPTRTGRGFANLVSACRFLNDLTQFRPRFGKYLSSTRRRPRFAASLPRYMITREFTGTPEIRTDPKHANQSEHTSCTQGLDGFQNISLFFRRE
jgi:hypothetical protein